jgi:outer membrane lipopolysaccharide assembly protein LptE/RlpB
MKFPRNGATKMARLPGLLTVLALLAATGCGYHTSGKAVRLPSDLHTIAIPTFVNPTESYRVDQIITQAVAREFNTRTNYRVVPQTDDADATLNGRITGFLVSPVTYDSTTGRTSTAMVTISMAVRLVDKRGKVLFEQPGYVFREEYEVSRDITTFFQEESPAVDRLAGDFARNLVSNVLEAF